MRAVAVGRLHDHVIRRRKILRILDERAVPRSDVSGKYDLALLHALTGVLGDPHLNTGRSKQMSRIHKPDFQAFADIYHTVVIAGYKMSQNPHRIIHIVERYDLRLPGALRLAILPLRLKHLDMCAVLEHNLTQLMCRCRRKNLPAEAMVI